MTARVRYALAGLLVGVALCGGALWLESRVPVVVPEDARWRMHGYVQRLARYNAASHPSRIVVSCASVSTDAQIAEWVRRAATLTDAQIDAIILAAAREARAVAALASEIEAAAGEMTRGEA